MGTSPIPRDFNNMTGSYPSLGDEQDPPGLSGELPPPDSSTVDDPDIPPILAQDIILY
jgi:hypothetical protein